MILSSLLLSASMLAMNTGESTQPAATTTTVASGSVFAERLYTSTGDVIENALILFKDGKISAITPGTTGRDGSLRAAAVTAGLIDASARIHPRGHSVEQSVEIQPALRVLDSLDPFDRRWKQQLRAGVTSVLISPQDDNVIGGMSAVLKTGGANTIAERVIKRDAVLRGAMGSQPSRRNHPAFRSPSDFYSRRPTTRMGVEWEWRKAFYDAEAATRLPEREHAGSETLRRALAGEFPVMIQAWATQDIRTAVFLKEEMQREGLGDLKLIIDAGAEAWREPELLKRSKAAVVLPPFSSSGRTTDQAFMPWNLAKALYDEGITIALSGHGSSVYDQSLAYQASHAMRGGLPFDAALAAVTLIPARLLGVEGRVGSIEVGKDADLVLWSGKPLERTSRVIGVVLEGEVVVDPRPE